MPTLLLTGEVSTDPSKPDVETVAAALPTVLIEILAGQQHLADIGDSVDRDFDHEHLVTVRLQPVDSDNPSGS